MNINELSKELDKAYWRDKQHLYVASIEVLDYNSPNAGPFSIYTINPKTGDFETYLFEVQNYNAIVEEIPHVEKSILYPEKFDYKWKFDVDKASCAVFYNARERLYTIPKFTSITKDDILRCFRHFRKYSDSWLLFNVSWYDFPEEKTKETIDKL